jgi:type IV pilus assembly protein PilW
MMNLTRFSSPSQRRQRGFSLVELMVALVLGLLVIGGVGGVFLSQRELYHQNENLARMQENARYAFEVMARSLREAGGNLCGASKMANVLNNASSTSNSDWWANWDNAVRGFEGGNTTHDSQFPQSVGTDPAERAKRVANTDAIIVMSGTLNEEVTVTSHNSDPPYFTVNNPGIDKGDILLVCDYEQAAIFQTTNVDSSNCTNVDSSNCTIKIEHNTDANTGASVSPGNSRIFANCSPPPNDPRPCPGCFSFISKLAAYAWYIGYNGRGGRSLYRLKLQNNNGTAGDTAEEVAEGVINLQIQYLTRDAAGNLATGYVDAGQVADWTKVVAVRLEFTLQSLENVATGGGALQRTWNTVVTLRNRP